MRDTFFIAGQAQIKSASMAVYTYLNVCVGVPQPNATSSGSVRVRRDQGSEICIHPCTQEDFAWTLMAIRAGQTWVNYKHFCVLLSPQKIARSTTWFFESMRPLLFD